MQDLGCSATKVVFGTISVDAFHVHKTPVGTTIRDVVKKAVMAVVYEAAGPLTIKRK